ncbi:MAG TPA: transcription elongation factor GreA [Anaerolineae bacterium]|nr:transcription elongation factor GreA [Anaerolineae bacterium]
MFEPTPTYLTPEGKLKLEVELDDLKTNKRRELAERLNFAIKQGDLSENADYIAAKEDQAFLEGRIHTIEGMLRHVSIITEQLGGEVRIGSRISVTEAGFDAREAFLLVGAAEANPLEGKISNESPLGKALLGKHIGDEVEIDAPAGRITFRIVAIE